MTDELCWWCESALPRYETFGVVTVIHEHGDSNATIRRCCTTTCARKAVTWTRPGNQERDTKHEMYARMAEA